MRIDVNKNKHAVEMVTLYTKIIHAVGMEIFDFFGHYFPSCISSTLKKPDIISINIKYKN